MMNPAFLMSELKLVVYGYTDSALEIGYLLYILAN